MKELKLKSFMFLIVGLLLLFIALFSCSQDQIDLSYGEVIYHSFEQKPADWWSWGTDATTDLSASGEPSLEGNHSLKLTCSSKTTAGDYSTYLGSGFKCQSDTWSVDLNPTGVNNQLVLWVYAMPNVVGNHNLCVEIFDNKDHSSDARKIAYWTTQKAYYREWTKIVILFSDILAWVDSNDSTNKGSNIDLHDINKLQIQFYWGGTYYIDSIKATNDVKIIRTDD